MCLPILKTLFIKMKYKKSMHNKRFYLKFISSLLNCLGIHFRIIVL